VLEEFWENPPPFQISEIVKKTSTSSRTKTYHSLEAAPETHNTSVKDS
jgi:hypothetical protein